MVDKESEKSIIDLFTKYILNAVILYLHYAFIELFVLNYIWSTQGIIASPPLPSPARAMKGASESKLIWRYLFQKKRLRNLT